MTFKPIYKVMNCKMWAFLSSLEQINVREGETICYNFYPSPTNSRFLTFDKRTPESTDNNTNFKLFKLLNCLL